MAPSWLGDASPAIGRLENAAPWCPLPSTADYSCEYFSAIHTVTTARLRPGVWIFELRASGAAFLELDDVRLTPSGCAEYSGDRCLSVRYAHLLEGAGTHKLAVMYSHFGAGSAFERLDWVYSGDSCGGGQWEVAIYDGVGFEPAAFKNRLCVPRGSAADNTLLDTRSAGLPGGREGVPCLPTAAGQAPAGQCWCPTSLARQPGEALRCGNWSATFTAEFEVERGGSFRFLASRAALTSPSTQLRLAMDGVAVPYSGCVLASGICTASIYQSGDLTAGPHNLVVSMDEAGPADLRLEWQRAGHGCAAHEWRVETMGLDADEIIAVTCTSFDSSGFLALPLDWPCPVPGAGGACSFRAAFSRSVNFAEAGIYRFSQRFRDVSPPSPFPSALTNRCSI